MYFSLFHFYGFYSFLIVTISTLPVTLKSTKNVPHLHLKKKSVNLNYYSKCLQYYPYFIKLRLH